MDESCKTKRTDVSKTFSNTLPKYSKHTSCHLLWRSLNDCGQLSGVIKTNADDKLFETTLNTCSSNDTCQHISLSDCGASTRVIKPTPDDKLFETKLNTRSNNDTRQHISLSGCVDSTRVIKPTPEDKLFETKIKGSNDTCRHKTAINVIVDKLLEPRKFFTMKGYNCVWNLLFILLCLVQIKRNTHNYVSLSDKMLCEDWKTPMVQNTEKINKSYLLSDLFKLHVFPPNVQITLPFTNRQYDSKFNESPFDNSMSQEMFRLYSLRNFPQNINISLVRLAQTGFYHTGQGSETKCYSCGVTYRDWTSGDNPMRVHRRISPSCNLVINNGSNRSFEDNSTLYRTSERSSISNNTNSQQGVHQTNTIYSQTDRFNSDAHQPLLSNCDIPVSVSNQTVNCSAVSNECEHDVPNNHENKEITTMGDGHSGHKHNGTQTKKPRYPNYEPLQVRISSYQGWPSYLNQTPRDMALAGFLFAGYNNYTRCFQCGGGLRNWEAGDDPWVEHARWFPQCSFVRQNRGQRFIDAVMRKQKQRETEQAKDACCARTSEKQPIASTSQTSGTNDRQYNFLQTVAARSVLEMGYTNEQVLEALNNITTLNHSVSAMDILNVILNKDADFQPQLSSASNGVRTAYESMTSNSASTQHESVASNNARTQHESVASNNARTQHELVASNDARTQHESVASTDARTQHETVASNDARTQHETVASNDARTHDETVASNDTRTQHTLVASNDTRTQHALVAANSARTEYEPMASGGASSDNNETESLLEENQQLRYQMLCKVCFELNATVAFLPCGHIVCCTDCAPAMRKCPFCRAYVRGTVKTFFA